jgi:hypothetical protein
MPAIFVRLPELDRRPHCARSEHDDDVFMRFPARSRRPFCSDAHAGGTHFAKLPTRSVSSARSHLRVERVAVRRKHDTVARVMRRRER